MANQAFPRKPVDVPERHPGITGAKIPRPTLQPAVRFSDHSSDRHEAEASAGQFPLSCPAHGLAISSTGIFSGSDAGLSGGRAGERLCPICESRMETEKMKGGILIDVCSKHGRWLEKGESEILTRRIEAWRRRHIDRRITDAMQRGVSADIRVNLPLTDSRRGNFRTDTGSEITTAQRL